MFLEDCAKHKDTFKAFLQGMAFNCNHDPQAKDKIKIN